ncbi:MAG: phosphoglycerate dehydrogenase [Actinomycetota bacterium]
MGRVLVTEELAERGLAKMRDAGHEVDVRLGLSPAELLEVVPGAHALVVRSETKVTPEVLEAGRDLVIVGRAGVGIDNVDVAAATGRGVMVANAPLSNVVSNAEHTMALLLALARNVPQASESLKAGKWARSKWTGIELYGKTLGLLGLGRVGTLVAQRATAFGLRVVAWDPWISPERPRKLGIELLELDELVRQVDFLSVHLLKTPDSVGLIGADLLAKAKPSLRIVNTARGGIIDEHALAEAIAAGRVGGAAIDVFATEPTTDSPLFGLERVVVTPHLGASTHEAQDKAGEAIADQVVLALAGDFVPYAVNVDAAEAADAVKPYLALAERLGRIFTALHRDSGRLAAGPLQVGYQGELADYDTRILTLAVLKGLLTGQASESVSYVNAPKLAAEAGIALDESKSSETEDYVNLITVRGPDHSIAGTLFGLGNEARLVMVDDHTVDIPPARHMLVVRNDDRPGMIGVVGTLLGRTGVNISDMDVGRSPSGEAALMVLSTDQPVPDQVLEGLRSEPGIVRVDRLSQDPG